MDRTDLENALLAIRTGSLLSLEIVRATHRDFPNGEDPLYGQVWFTHAIEFGTPQVAIWMIAHGVPVNYRDKLGYTPLHLCIESSSSHKYKMLALLIGAGAKLECKGLNDWTPLHLAACRNDVQSVGLLLAAGADPDVRTEIDSRATPAEEARTLGAIAAAELIEGWQKLMSRIKP